MANVSDALILPTDVMLVPVTELSESLRQRFQYDADDVAVTRLQSRQPSKIVSAETAALLKEFHTATTIVEAVLRYSLSHRSDPRDVLEQAFPVIQLLVNAQLLLPADSPHSGQITATLGSGVEVGSWTITACVQVMQDTEVYQACDPQGRIGALKIARPHARQRIAAMLEREAAILSALNGQISPVLLETGVLDERRYLIQSWCDGVPATVAADELRQEQDRSALAALCIRVLRAYARLHAQQIVHGDVHPNNVLIDADGQAQIIDFGLARSIAADQREPHRGGVAFFFEPEYAEASRAHRPEPPVTPQSEQYALGALLYHLLTGVHYVNFSLERDTLLRQIVEEPPLPFAAHNLPPWPAVEAVLSRALRKAPDARYPDVATFAAELERAAHSTQEPSPRSERSSRPAAESLLANVLRQVDWDGPLLNGELPAPPTASVNYGAAGIAYFLYRVASVRGDPSLLALADAWATRALHKLADPTAFYHAPIEITPETVGRISPYHTLSGVYAVHALIAGARGDEAWQAESLAAFVGAIQQPCDNLDVTLGQSGILVVGALLAESLLAPSLIETSGLRAAGDATLQRLWAELQNIPPIHAAATLPHLGIAHGWAGLLYATLRWCEVTGGNVSAAVEDRLQQLKRCAVATGRGVQWPWRILSREPQYMPGWCNGSAGYVFLWTAAHRRFGDADFAGLAQKAAWNCWEDPAQSGNLCCGLAGRGYALLHWYKYSGEPAWLQRAQLTGERAAVAIRNQPTDEYRGYEHSLYKGETGVAALISDLADPECAAMPLFESER